VTSVFEQTPEHAIFKNTQIIAYIFTEETNSMNMSNSDRWVSRPLHWGENPKWLWDM